MAAKRSAGLLLFRRTNGPLEVLLGHPGGPFWAKKDDGAWTIPKGEVDSGEPLDAALREFKEETNLLVAGPFIDLGEIRQKSGKHVQVWAAEGDPDLAEFRSNEFSLEWPPRSGRQQVFPELDRITFFPIDQARAKLLPAQREFLDRLVARLGEGSGSSP